MGEELRHNSHWPLRIDSAAPAVEVAVAQAVGVEVAAGLITDGVALCSSTTVGATQVAGVRGEGRVQGIGLPDVHLSAAGTVAANGSLCTPILHIGLAPHPLEVVRALRVAVAGAVLGARWVGAAPVASGVHLDEVKRAVQAAWQVGDVDVECELAILQLEELVGVLVLHQVGARADVCRVRPPRHELQFQPGVRPCDPVGARPSFSAYAV
mmetsp:Transcript_94783/g.263624  ORF Transcript_94783/g.263624 Transcript_94783/m.263624 type:complete len:211 (+) Transcript_94783:873-1505(+)